MQLTMKDLIRWFKVSERTITRWILRDKLPCSYIGMRYRFNRSDLFEWATGLGIRVPAHVFDNAPDPSGSVISLAAALEAGGVFYDLGDASRESALQSVVDVMPLRDDLDRKLLFDLFLARESLASTAVGDGIAIPHVRHPLLFRVPRPVICLCFLHEAIEFGALDGKPVGTLFAIISPSVRLHLRLLARLSFALHDTQFKKAVLRQASQDEIVEQARRIDSEMKSEPAPANGAWH